MTNSEALREERAVGVSVEVDLVDLEIIEDRREVVRRERRAVDIRGLGEPAPALADRLDVIALVGLERLAEDRLRTSGSAVVDQQEAAAVEHRFEEIEVVVAARGGCVPRAPFYRHDGSERRLGAVPAGVELVADLHGSEQGIGRVGQNGGGAALGVRDSATVLQFAGGDAPVFVDRAWTGGGERTGQEGEDHRQCGRTGNSPAGTSPPRSHAPQTTVTTPLIWSGVWNRSSAGCMIAS